MEQSHYDFDYMFKFVIIGDSYQVLENRVFQAALAIINLNSSMKQLWVQIWQFNCSLSTTKNLKSEYGIQQDKKLFDQLPDPITEGIDKIYLRAIGILLVFDITNRISFENIRSWHNEIKEYANENTKIILVANKTDLAKQRQVSAEEGQTLAREIQCAYIETSALSNINIEKAFLNLSKEVLELINQGKLDLEDKNCGVIVSTKSIPQQHCKC